MILISHRGNLSEINLALENSPSYITSAIEAGYQVEIDLRVIDGKPFLGHDTPDYQIDYKWLLDNANHLYVHCKNYDAIRLMSESEGFRWFCHQNDVTGLVSDGYLWCSDLESPPHSKCLAALLSLEQLQNYKYLDVCGGVCSDFILKCKERLGK